MAYVRLQLVFIELKIRKMLKVNSTDDDWLKAIKTKVAANVARRLMSKVIINFQLRFSARCTFPL